MSRRDEFPAQVKEALAKRVAFLCSRPGCGQTTSGPHLDVTKAVNLGVAAHIAAAAAQGPRYDPSMTREQRIGIDNGIWLCLPCSTLIDRDFDRYSSGELHRWKADAEAAAYKRLSHRPTATSPVAVREELAAHRTAILRRLAQLDWWQHPLPLAVRSGKGVRDGRALVSQWCTSDLSSHLVIIGEAGSGKSGLVLWAESELQDRDDVVTLLVPAARLRSVNAIDLAALSTVAVSPLSADLVGAVTRDHTLILLLDGLDELVGADLGGVKLAASAMRDLSSSLPPKTRIIATCRKAAYASIEGMLRDALPDNVAERDFLYQSVIRKVVNGADLLEVIEIAPIPRSEALPFLASVVDSTKLAMLNEPRWDPYLGSPMLLSLLRSVLPALIEADLLALDKIYELYVRQALIRANPRIREAEISDACASLRRFSNILHREFDERDISAGLKAGLLRRDQNFVGWTHFTLWEYFFASFLFEEIISASSETLAHMDLVNGYNLNRLLVPMLNRSLRSGASVSTGEVRGVSPRDYRHFIARSGWRRTRYGRHPSISASRDGVASSTFKYDPKASGAYHNSLEHGEGRTQVACQLSWYDAAAYARWTKTRLPTSDEVRAAAPGGDFLFWCSDWRNEQVAHMCAFASKSGEVVGLNPDVRLDRTALLVVA